ncbi:hypothetical protein MKEN_00641600 [Mycena kentingensis (nom. inval.)]|nr:hypothetical protein MKEN_00641600 [Mycena kentingensis (nom. inval.)]
MTNTSLVPSGQAAIFRHSARALASRPPSRPRVYYIQTANLASVIVRSSPHAPHAALVLLAARGAIASKDGPSRRLQLLPPGLVEPADFCIGWSILAGDCDAQAQRTRLVFMADECPHLFEGGGHDHVLLRKAGRSFRRSQRPRGLL